jgi:hypothetical protein
VNGFTLVFWGFLFMFDFRIQGVDILPNFIGYLLMYVGLQALSSLSPEFGKSKKYAVPLAVLSLFSIYQVQNPVGQFSITPLSVVSFTIGLITIFIDLLLVYHLCNGIINLANQQHDHNLQTTASQRWKYYLVYKVALAIFLPLGLLVPFLLMVGFIPLFILSIFVLISMMTLMKNSQRSLRF